MKNNEKKGALIKALRKCFLVLGMLSATLMINTACEKDSEMPQENPQQQSPNGQTPQDSVPPQDSTDTQGNTLDADKLSEYLVLKDAVKINGNPPTTTDGQLQVDVKDTIYVIKGYPLGDRLQIKHQAGQNVTGFYVYVGSASYYFDVPEEENDYIPPQESDTTSVLVLDLDIPEDEGVDYPFTTEIVILPHDESGMPLDEFDRWVTVEDPDNASGNGCNSIMQPYEGLETAPRWRWDLTFWEQNGNIIRGWAPNRKETINSQGVGCCNEDTGRSYYVGETPGCAPNATSPGLTRVTLTSEEINDYVVRIEEYMWIYDTGVFNYEGIEDKKNWYSFDTNFCTKELSYLFSYEKFGAPNDTPVGTHDFTPGASRINLNLRNWQGPYRLPSSADIVYTCHSLLLIRESEGIDLFTSRYEDYTRNVILGVYERWHD